MRFGFYMDLGFRIETFPETVVQYFTGVGFQIDTESFLHKILHGFQKHIQIGKWRPPTTTYKCPKLFYAETNIYKLLDCVFQPTAGQVVDLAIQSTMDYKPAFK